MMYLTALALDFCEKNNKFIQIMRGGERIPNVILCSVKKLSA